MTLSDPKNRRRSQRVMLQLAVLVRANMPDGRCVRVQAFTLVVNAHGGLLESPLELTANQRINNNQPTIGQRGWLQGGRNRGTILGFVPSCF
jgi:hypothetical protein